MPGPAGTWPCSDRRVPARPWRCGSSRGWRSPAGAGSASITATSPPYPRTPRASATCRRIQRCWPHCRAAAGDVGVDARPGPRRILESPGAAHRPAGPAAERALRRQRRRVALVRALARTRVLLLDEPSAAARHRDPRGAARELRALQREPRSPRAGDARSGRGRRAGGGGRRPRPRRGAAGRAQGDVFARPATARWRACSAYERRTRAGHRPGRSLPGASRSPPTGWTRRWHRGAWCIRPEYVEVVPEGGHGAS